MITMDRASEGLGTTETILKGSETKQNKRKRTRK
jgi:hypothetical protein